MSCFVITLTDRTYKLTFTEKRYTITLTNKPISIAVSCYAVESGIGNMRIGSSFIVR